MTGVSSEVSAAVYLSAGVLTSLEALVGHLTTLYLNYNIPKTVKAGHLTLIHPARCDEFINNIGIY